MPVHNSGASNGYSKRGNLTRTRGLCCLRGSNECKWNGVTTHCRGRTHVRHKRSSGGRLQAHACFSPARPARHLPLVHPPQPTPARSSSCSPGIQWQHRQPRAETRGCVRVHAPRPQVSEVSATPHTFLSGPHTTPGNPSPRAHPRPAENVTTAQHFMWTAAYRGEGTSSLRRGNAQGRGWGEREGRCDGQRSDGGPQVGGPLLIECSTHRGRPTQQATKCTYDYCKP